MRKDRNRWEIILDILKVTKEEGKVKKTRIMYKANLDWRNFKRYFEYLQADGFITKCNTDPDFYELTEDGKNLLQKLKELNEILREGSPQFPVKIFPAVSQKAVA